MKHYQLIPIDRFAFDVFLKRIDAIASVTFRNASRHLELVKDVEFQSRVFGLNRCEQKKRLVHLIIGFYER